MSASIESKTSWYDAHKSKKVTYLATLLVVIFLLVCSKYNYLFSKDTRFVIRNGRPQTVSKADYEAIKKANLKNESASDSKNGKSASHPERMSSGGRGIIERPLFDGQTVILKAVLLGAVSSLEPESPVEAEVKTAVLEQNSFEVDTTSVEKARIVGVLASNMNLRRLNFSFNELTTKEGRTYTVQGFAVDPETKALGVAANYSSGLGSRLLGVGLDRAIVATDQIAMAKVIEGINGDSTASKELQRASIETNQQAAMSISSEATKSLRETPAELSLPAGTELIIRIKATGR